MVLFGYAVEGHVKDKEKKTKLIVFLFFFCFLFINQKKLTLLNMKNLCLLRFDAKRIEADNIITIRNILSFSWIFFFPWGASAVVFLMIKPNPKPFFKPKWVYSIYTSTTANFMTKKCMIDLGRTTFSSSKSKSPTRITPHEHVPISQWTVASTRILAFSSTATTEQMVASFKSNYIKNFKARLRNN